jgi:chemotaxis family two-component system response regulator Rcp1
MEPVNVLLVEDNPGDARLTKEALAEGRIHMNLTHVDDGVKAMAALKQDGDYADVPRPDLILLDLNLPLKDGREVLEEMKSMPELSSIPVIVLTTSENEEDVLKSYELNANCYITKSVDFDSFMHVIKSIDEFWFSIVKLPKNMPQ